VKAHLFPLAVVAAYAGLFVFRLDMGLASVRNSAYYIKEMLMIMPVIFVLTALLDAWVPKGQIMRFLGVDAGAKGAAFALLLGSISAGPIYAAFPLCTMLHKKGASVRNLVIILSAWAVVKVPMLLNELKFLGVQFMAVRWALTVLAIIAFSWMTAKVVKDSDLPAEVSVCEAREEPAQIDRAACMGCSLCAGEYPELFEMKDRKASLREIEAEPDAERLDRAIRACPVGAIRARNAPDQ
jgi:ferredoxin